jgi:dihydroflavonol-4-reductase
MQDETSPWQLGPLRIPYVTTKRRAEELALATADAQLQVVVVNPACVIGPGDFSGSEFGVLCRRFWKRQVPFFFGGGNNFVDVRDVADGMLRAALLGESGQRYILGGSNLTFHAFFAELARAAGRPIFRLRLPGALVEPLARLSETWSRPGSRPTVSATQARLLSRFFFFDTGKARRQLGFRPRLLRDTLADAHHFWMRRRSA